MAPPGIITRFSPKNFRPGGAIVSPGDYPARPIAQIEGVPSLPRGLWVSLSEANYARVGELWTDPRRINEPPYFGWLSTELPYEPTTLNLKTEVHTQSVGTRPVVELEPADHPLAVEQRTGIACARVQYFAERLAHPDSATRATAPRKPTRAPRRPRRHACPATSTVDGQCDSVDLDILSRTPKLSTSW